MLELYHWEPNTSSLKPLVVLHEKGLAFTSHYVDFGTLEQYVLSNVDATLEVKHNPDGEGPILVDGGVPMTEALFLSLYLDEAYPQNPLRPADAYGRWTVLKWARFLNEVVGPAAATLGCHRYLAPALKRAPRADIESRIADIPTKERRDGWLAALNGDYPEELLDDSRRKIGVAVKAAEDALANGDWIANSAYSLADIDAFSLLAPAKALEPAQFAAASRTNAWLERVGARPAVKAAFKTSKTGTPLEAFAPGPEHSRWG